MPKRQDIKSVLVIGSGPIVIGQACEFDYSGTQACRVLQEEGIRVILVNSNPATIMVSFFMRGHCLPATLVAKATATYNTSSGIITLLFFCCIFPLPVNCSLMHHLIFIYRFKGRFPRCTRSLNTL